ncbi:MULTISPECIES: SigE family RNA polymerase sigma factor [Kitasatospora]|uniref:Putative RNA polymerase ECF subfamily sigma factor n=1 Tax=Kitasatospora setae (strain ATCC 33774 / DSM 43861 / JCM 3304 / KCC A-0304 / NBRC 14216 / KM-6054) TaxID=452652 RepID=E4NC11_KITSK|nr:MULTISPECIES: SigE family RNA polymerase sigma factor [Kitasatospora]BAJ28742.1 putative RNA polymerase ECF subfamily sigma factor [Kitasatospora setae KM-6054]
MTELTRDEEFTAFVASRAVWLRKVAYLLCADWHRADDLVQESITKLYTHWGRAGRVENRDGYARTVLVNTFLAEQRTAWWRRTRPTARPVDGTAPEPDLAGSLDLREALAALPPRQRATVVLRYFCDLTIEQTAAELGCSHGNVKSQSSRALESLRRSPVLRPTGRAEA